MRKKAKKANVRVTTIPTEKLIFEKRLWNKKSFPKILLTRFPRPGSTLETAGIIYGMILSPLPTSVS
jgi:hypothetical protein